MYPSKREESATAGQNIVGGIVLGMVYCSIFKLEVPCLALLYTLLAHGAWYLVDGWKFKKIESMSNNDRYGVAILMFYVFSLVANIQ